MDLLVVVPTMLQLFLSAPGPQRLGNITIFVLATDHEPNLSARICRNRSVSVLDGGEDFFTRLLELGDELDMKPYVLGCRTSLAYGERTEHIDI